MCYSRLKNQGKNVEINVQIHKFTNIQNNSEILKLFSEFLIAVVKNLYANS